MKTLVAASLLALCACSSPPVLVGVEDSGTSMDASVEDSGTAGGGNAVDSGAGDDAGTDAGALADSGITDAGMMGPHDAGPLPDAGFCILTAPETACGARPCCQLGEQCLPGGVPVCPNNDIAMRCRFARDCGPALKCFLAANKSECSANGPAGAQLLCDPAPLDGGANGCPTSAPSCERYAGALYHCAP